MTKPEKPFASKYDEEQASQRTRFGKWEWVSFSLSVVQESGFVPKENVQVRIEGDVIWLHLKKGYCPCAVCNHTYVWECNVSDQYGRTEACCHFTCT